MKRFLTLLVLSIFLSFSNTAFAATELKVAVGDPEDSEQGLAAKTFKEYVEKHSFFYDFGLILKTLWVILKKR